MMLSFATVGCLFSGKFAVYFTYTHLSIYIYITYTMQHDGKAGPKYHQ